MDDPPQAHDRPACPQCADDVAQVALRLALVMRLGEALAGERLVGNLGLAAPRIRVVDRRPIRGPLHEAPPTRASRCEHRVAHAPIALGVDDDRAHPVLDRARRQPGLRDRLARAGGAHHQRVPSPQLSAEGNRDGPRTLIGSEQQPPPAQPGPACGHSASELDPCQHAQQSIGWRPSLAREPGEVGARLQVFAVPAPTPGDGCRARDA